MANRRHYIPDSKLAREITELVWDTEPPLLFRHSSRVFCWGALTGPTRPDVRCQFAMPMPEPLWRLKPRAAIETVAMMLAPVTVWCLIPRAKWLSLLRPTLKV
jgi:hypothetical protein